jgi:hypothetical protein
MVYKTLIIVLLFCQLECFSQNKQSERPPILPIPSVGYFYQGTHNPFAAIGPGHYFKRHSFLALQAGLEYFRRNKTGYISPSFTLKYFYQLKKLNIIGPVANINYTAYKINGLKDKYISFDAGFVIYQGWAVFGGYNYNLDKKDHNLITPYRIGIRFL